MATIIGISAYYHDSAATLIKDGEIIAAAQEERFTRKKHDSSFPKQALEYILSESKYSLNDVNYVSFYDKPFLKFERIIETYLAHAPKGFRSFCMAMPVWLREKLFLKKMIGKSFKTIDKEFDNNKILFSEHHFSHAASAFYPSPFQEAIVLTLDGVGEWATSSVAIGSGNHLEIVKEINFPHSIGLLYSAFTFYLGFRVNSGEYKVMGLAPYGEPKYAKIILENLIDLKEDGSFRLNQTYFNYANGLTMTNNKFENIFGKQRRKAESEQLTQFHMDIAASIQFVTEKVVLQMTRSLRKEFDIENLCLAGGVALNCVANGKILSDSKYKGLWIQPAAGDAGGSLGAALATWYHELGNERVSKGNDHMKGSYLGSKFSQKEIEKNLEELGAVFTVYSQQDMLSKVVESLVNGQVIGWFQGRMEFGPRALGNRSIIADPRSETMQKSLNLKIKFRESFRPFAPSVLSEAASDWFELSQMSPYMLLVANIKNCKKINTLDRYRSLVGLDKLKVKRSMIPAVTHVDYSARVQTVHKDTNPLYHRLIKMFYERTACPVLINTSFNVRGEPIVQSPKDAYQCFMGNDMDVLVIGNCIMYKKEQARKILKNYRNNFNLD